MRAAAAASSSAAAKSLVSDLLADPAPKDVIVQYDADELRALRRQRPA